MTPERVRRHLQARFNPIRSLTPQSLSTMLDSFSAGFLREFAIAADKIEERDDILKAVVPKRQKSVSRHGWEICTVDDSPEAARHKEALESFYNSMECTHALNRNQRGGFKLLVRQMMDAVGKGLAVHEMLWKPGGSGGLSAEFVFTPLWFFENTTGRLRFLQDDYQQYGIDLEPGGWMVTATDALMPASAVAWMFKNLSLKDWVTYCERHGMPGIRGVTSAARGSAEWNEMVDAVTDFASEFAAVMSDAERIEAIDLKGSGELPYPGLVERMDRALATIWRGADLGTISRGGDSAGASLQGDETDVIEQDDAEMISETLNMQVEPIVLAYQFGEGVDPLAYLRIPIPDKQDTTKDIEVDTFLTSHGVRLSKSDALERYGRSEADGDDDALTAPAPAPAPVMGGQDGQDGLDGPDGLDGLENEEDSGAGEAGAEVAKALASDLKPVIQRLLTILEIEDAEIRSGKLAVFRDNYPKLAKDILADPAAAEVMERLMGSAMARGMQKGVKT